VEDGDGAYAPSNKASQPERPRRRNRPRVVIAGGFRSADHTPDRRGHPADLLSREERLRRALRALGELVLRLQERSGDAPSSSE
jgi:hypothetical protein